MCPLSNEDLGRGGHIVLHSCAFCLLLALKWFGIGVWHLFCHIDPVCLASFPRVFSRFAFVLRWNSGAAALPDSLLVFCLVTSQATQIVFLCCTWFH